MRLASDRRDLCAKAASRCTHHRGLIGTFALSRATWLSSSARLTCGTVWYQTGPLVVRFGTNAEAAMVTSRILVTGATGKTVPPRRDVARSVPARALPAA